METPGRSTSGSERAESPHPEVVPSLFPVLRTLPLSSRHLQDGEFQALRAAVGGPQQAWDGVPGTDTPVLSPQKPILLQGHERSITQIKYNREGDLLFTVAKDPVSDCVRAGGRADGAGCPEGRVRAAYG